MNYLRSQGLGQRNQPIGRSCRDCMTHLPYKQLRSWHSQRQIKEIHLPWNRCRLLTSTHFLQASIFSCKNAQATILLCGMMKDCFSESTRKPKYSKEVVGYRTDLLIPIVYPSSISTEWTINMAALAALTPNSFCLS